MTYETFVWLGQTRYLCPVCGFDSPEVERVQEHIRLQHYVEPGDPTAGAFTLLDEATTDVDA